MGSNSRYDRARPVGDREAAKAPALHLIGELVGDYPAITSRAVAGQVAAVLHAAAIELDNGRHPRRYRYSARGPARDTLIVEGLPAPTHQRKHRTEPSAGEECRKGPVLTPPDRQRSPVARDEGRRR